MSLDLNALTPTASEPIEARKGNRTPAEIPEHALNWVRNAHSTTIGFDVEAQHIESVVRLLNKAAAREDLGVKIRVVDAKGTEHVPNKALYEQLEGKTNKLHIKWSTGKRTRRPRAASSVVAE